MTIDKEDLKRVLTEAFEDAEIKIKPLVEDDDHYSVHVKSACFSGESLVSQHRMVYQALKDAGVDLHAIAIQTEEKEDA